MVSWRYTSTCTQRSPYILFINWSQLLKYIFIIVVFWACALSIYEFTLESRSYKYLISAWNSKAYSVLSNTILNMLRLYESHPTHPNHSHNIVYTNSVQFTFLIMFSIQQQTTNWRCYFQNTFRLFGLVVCTETMTSLMCTQSKSIQPHRYYFDFR